MKIELIQVQYAISCTLSALILVIALHNIIVYLCRLCINRTLIILFYLFVVLLAFAKIFRYAILMVYPNDYQMHRAYLHYQTYLMAAFVIGLYQTINLILYQLVTSIQLLLNEIDGSRAKCKLVIGYVILVISMLTIVLVKVLVKEKSVNRFISILTIFVLVEICNLVFVIVLRHKMKKLTIEDLKSETNSVTC